MSISQPHAENSRTARHRARRHPRRGVVALLAIWALVIFLLIAAWVINYNFLVLVNRNMQQKSDAVVLAAAVELLDEDALRDYPGSPVPDQTDDLEAARAVAGQYCHWNNRVQAEKLSIHAGDMTVQSGFVADITGNSPFRFDRTIPLDDPHPPHNTLHVDSRRLADGRHPVRYLLDMFRCGRARAADVSGGAYATLDNLVVGFRPTVSAASPVMPMAIHVDAWNDERPGGNDTNDNGIRELVLRLEMPPADPSSPDPQPQDANAVLMLLDGTVSTPVLTDQIATGLFPGDLLQGVLGPATPASSWLTTGMQRVDESAYTTLNIRLAGTINFLVSMGPLKRVFPLYGSFVDGDHDGIGEVRLIGFVACNVLSAEAPDSENRLKVTVEPCFVIHHTTWTVAPDDASGPPRNTYVHKLRLSH